MRDINSLNKVILIGRLGQDPELKYIPQTQTAVANFTLATNESHLNKQTNEYDIKAEWHKIVVWGKTAEFCEKYITKGKQVLIEGKLRTRSWEDKEGKKHYMTEVHAQAVTLLGKKDEDDGESKPSYEPKPAEDYDDEVPF